MKKLKIINFSLALALTISVIWVYPITLHTAPVSSLELSFKSDGDLVFYADLYQFESTDSKNRVEVCYSIDLSQFKDQTNTDLILDVKFVDKNNVTVTNHIDKKSIEGELQKSGGNSLFLDLLVFELSSDTLTFNLYISDPGSGKKGIIEKIIVIYDFSDKLSLSDPVFVSYLNKSENQDNIFSRHGYTMLPNPSRIFTVTEKKDMYLYFDINNLEYDQENPSLYKLDCIVEDLKGEELSKIEYNEIKKIGENTSRIEKISLDNFKSGMYNLKINIADLANDQTATQQRYFTVYSEDTATETLLPMAEEDVQKYYDQIKYIATDRELNIFEQLDKKGKQEFLLQFWKRKDPSPGTPENEYMIEHFQKIRFCEENFKNGLNSDQARIYIFYGPPIDIERSASTVDYTKPTEIWHYTINGRSEFIFVDRTNDDVYVLVHSTHPDEYSNPDWMQMFNSDRSFR